MAKTDKKPTVQELDQAIVEAIADDDMILALPLIQKRRRLNPALGFVETVSSMQFLSVALDLYHSRVTTFGDLARHPIILTATHDRQLHQARLEMAGEKRDPLIWKLNDTRTGWEKIELTPRRDSPGPEYGQGAIDPEATYRVWSVAGYRAPGTILDLWPDMRGNFKKNATQDLPGHILRRCLDDGLEAVYKKL